MQVDTIIKELEHKIKSLNTEPTIESVGTVLSVADGIAYVSGLDDVMSMEAVTFQSGATGLVLNLESDKIGVVLLDKALTVAEGHTVTRTKEVLSVSVSEEMVGRVVDPLGRPIDGGKDFVKKGSRMKLEKIAPGVMQREPVNQPMLTGIKAIDALVPIGRGQRELIIGDRQTGKTAIALDTIMNQHDQNMICVYVAIGQKESKVAHIVEELKKSGAMKYTIVVSAGASAGAAYSYLAPYAGVAIAEYFMDKRQDVLIVYDDLSKHAVAYREMSLLLKRPPGREAYPGDVFYLHSRLLERACRRNDASGGGSITALPIIETQAGDISAYVPTNVISITDGQIFLDANLFYKGMRPAIDVGLSVSRVGGSAQGKSMKKNAGKMKLAMAQFRELESFSQFDSDLDADTKATIERGKRVAEMLKQRATMPVSMPLEVVSVWLVNNGYFDDIAISGITEFESFAHGYYTQAHADLLEAISKDWTPHIEEAIKIAAKECKDSYANKSN